MNNKNKEIDYEVEGCWSSLTSKTKCRNCGTLLEEVHKEGHPNSDYWELQQHAKERLICCPNNCSVIIAENKIKEFLKVRNYCIDNSESWNFKLDYKIIKHAWIDRKGKVYPMDIREHVSFAYDLNTSEQALEQKGWLKLTGRDLMWEKALSKKQIDFVFDYLVTNGLEKLTKEFMNYSKSESRYFNTGKKNG